MRRALFVLLLFAKIAAAQTPLTLAECHEAARTNWPLSAQKGIFEQQTAVQIQNLRKNRLPQVSALAQATLQNEVTKLSINLPIPGFEAPAALSLDQYKLAVDANWTILDGGFEKAQKAVFEANLTAEQQKIDVELRKLNEQVDLFFFQSLLADEGLALADALQKDLETRLSKLDGAVKNGTAIAASADALRAEILKIEQRKIELRTARKTFRALLAELTGLEINEDKPLKINELDAKTAAALDFSKRPEFSLFEKQKRAAAAQSALLDARLRPRLAAFGQAGLGRPGFNFLKNEFRPFALVGLRATWSLTGFYTRQNDRALIGLQTQLIDNQRVVLERSLTLQARQQLGEIEKIEAVLDKDAEIIALRERVRSVAAVQLENGTITASDYLIEANAENQARLADRQRRVQLAFERARLQTIMNEN